MSRTPTTTRPLFWAATALTAALPTLPLSRAARTASAIALAGLATGLLAHDHIRPRGTR